MSLLLSEIANLCQGELTGPDRSVDLFLTDSRRIHLPKRSLFIAIPGVRNDGHSYISEALNLGLESFLVSDPSSITENGSYVLVEDSLRAFQQIAADHRRRFDYPVIGITGSYGKTELKDRSASLLGRNFHVVRSPKSYNSQTGVPLSLMAMNSGHSLGIFEAGISESGEMDSLAQMIKPDVGVFTTIGRAHEQGFNSEEEKIQEKCRLFSSTEVIIYPRDVAAIHEGIQAAFSNQGKTFFHWGSHPESQLHLLSKEDQNNGKINISYCTGGRSMDLVFNAVDEASFYSAMHSLSIAHVLGLSHEQIIRLFAEETEAENRTEIVASSYGKALLVDIGPIDGPSLRTSSEQLDTLIDHDGAQVILIDTGLSPLANDRKVLDLMTELQATDLILIGNRLKALSVSLPKADFHEELGSFLKNIDSCLDPSKAIILKGPWSPDLIALRSSIQERTHQTKVVVNMESLIHNLNTYRDILPEKTRTMAMVKAFAYGSGDAEVARLLQYHKVDELAVAYSDEGVGLRKQGVTLPIMVMNSSLSEFSQLIANRLAPEIYSLSLLAAFLEHCKKEQIEEYPIHLKFDTGMHRLGIEESELSDAIAILSGQSHLHVRSVFSHLYASDGLDEKASLEQIGRFEKIKATIEEQLEHPVLFHILNSAGITRFPEASYDMVRLGIGLYGFSGDAQFKEKLLPVIGWETIISQIKEVKKGETVGYGGHFTLDKDMRIAILPVGYADGISRLLGNGKAAVLIQGVKCPFVGNICMDMSMVDISEVNCREGEKVELIGPHIGIEELAEARDTIPYEVLTSIPPRVKRHYIFKG